MRWQTATHVLGSLALSSCFVSPLLGDTRSAEYYSTHHEERKKTLKRCEALILSAAQQGKDLSKEQKTMCGNAERGRGLARQRAEQDPYKEIRQKVKVWSKSLAQCYTKMADGLEKGQNGQSYLKTNKQCNELVRQSLFTENSLSYFPLLGFPMNMYFEIIYTDRKTHQYDDPKVRYPILIKCYRTFSANLLKNSSYKPLELDFRKTCRDAISKDFGHPLITTVNGSQEER
ncbi:hypothetical protein [Helicobacter bizzozeronii]|uniref:hypothetical protein n=1 Tax=Helicobacter bizzozeronii TaxID=56877 RepID=UPI000CEEFBC4|nr:hypothetical protein [Helicobacter bizzozeronii]